MLCCNSALTSPIDDRVLRKALRACAENHFVANHMKGAIARLINAKGTLAADGTVKLALDGYTSKGRAMAGEVTGTVVDNKLTVSGNWSNGTPVSATWLLGQ